MAKKVAETKSTQVLSSNNKVLSNRSLQSAIESVNSLIQAKKNFSATNAFKLISLAMAIDTAFKPAAKMITEASEDAQKAVAKILEKYKDERGDTDEVSAEMNAELNAVQSSYNLKMKELLDIELSVTYVPISEQVFRDKDGKDIDVELGVLYSLSPFMS